MKKTILSILIIAAAAAGANAQTKVPDNIQKLLQKNTCLACHNVDKKLVGPSYKDVAKQKKYKPAQIVELIYKPNPSHWPGYPPMAAMPQVPKAEATQIANWIAGLK